MKLSKKIISIVGSSMLVLSLPINVLASSSSSVPAQGYEYLNGAISYSVYDSIVFYQFSTTVNENNDNAYLTVKAEIQGKDGNTLYTENKTSSRGARVVDIQTNSTRFPSGAYALYGTHGVQGGSTYGAKATYTVTWVK